MKPILFYHPENKEIGKGLAQQLGWTEGHIDTRTFPDGETYLRLATPVIGAQIYLLCSLNNPDLKTNFILFFTKTAKELGANSVHLIAPYLGYMRQDKRFQDGEAVTSRIFAALLSSAVDSIITIDPHLHRHHDMNEIYTIPATVLHASNLLAQWVVKHINHPLLIGPDAESEQWVSALARTIRAPYQCLSKIRHGDRDVSISIPDPSLFFGRTPILVDDMVSTAKTMIEAIKHIRKVTTEPIFCMCIHPLFSGNAVQELQTAGASQIISCNTVPHSSNVMDIVPLLAEHIKKVP